MDTKKICEGIKSDGSRCKAAPLADSDFCYFHDPSIAAQRREAQSLGGHGNRLKTLDPDVPDVKLENSEDTAELLSQTINQVRKGLISPQVANSVGYLTGIAMKAAEQNELEARIRRLEALLKKRIAGISGEQQ